MISFVEKLLRKNLQIPDGITTQIERAHCALRPQPPENTQPRSGEISEFQNKGDRSLFGLAEKNNSSDWGNKSTWITTMHPTSSKNEGNIQR